MKRILCSLLVATLPFGSVLADAPKEKNAKVTLVYQHELPNVPGKALLAAEVLFPPGAAAPPHTHPKSAFIYAYVVSGEVISAVDDEKPRVYRAGESWHEAPGAHHPVTRNPSETTPAKLLVIFVADPGERQLVFPDSK